MSRLAGWYGKLPSLGDFASRRLPQDWIEGWDHWLAEGLQDLRQAAPRDWLNDYLASPAWRFALLPGVLEPELRVGVLMPSVDSVGRYYPLVICSPNLDAPASLADVQALWHWAGRLEDVAVGALQQDWSPEQLDAALGALPAAAASEPTLPPDDAGLGGLCAEAAWQALQGHTLWGTGSQSPRPVRGLPRGAAFQRLFSRAP